MTSCEAIGFLHSFKKRKSIFVVQFMNKEIPLQFIFYFFYFFKTLRAVKGQIVAKENSIGVENDLDYSVLYTN